jgi:hypothetical protein
MRRAALGNIEAALAGISAAEADADRTTPRLKMVVRTSLR